MLSRMCLAKAILGWSEKVLLLTKDSILLNTIPVEIRFKWIVVR